VHGIPPHSASLWPICGEDGWHTDRARRGCVRLRHTRRDRRPLAAPDSDAVRGPEHRLQKKTAGNLGVATGGTRTERGGHRDFLARVERQISRSVKRIRGGVGPRSRV